MARFLRTETNSSGGHSRLGNHLVGPAVPGIPPLAPPTSVNLAIDGRSRPRRNQIQRGAKSFRIQPPVVVGAGIAYGGPGVRLAEPESANDLNRRRRAKPFFIEATVIARPAYGGPRLKLTAPFTGKRREPKSFLRSPVLVFAPSFFGPGVVRPRVTNVSTLLWRRVMYDLRPPAFTTPTAPFVAGPIKVALAPQHKLSRRVHPRLAPPAVVGAGIAFVGPRKKISRTPPRKTLSFLRPPTRVSPVLAPPITINLVGRNRLIRARKTDSVLFPPIIPTTTFVAVPIATTLVGRNRLLRARKTDSLLRPPESAFQCLVTRYVSRRSLAPPAYLPGGNGFAGGTAVFFSDAFNRVTANGWGTADVGGAWTVTTGTASFDSTDGSVAKIVPGSVATQRLRLAAVSASDVDVYGEITFSATAATSNGEFACEARYTDTNNTLRFRVIQSTSGNIVVAVDEVVGGVATEIAVATPAFTSYIAGETISFRARAVGHAVSMVAWRKGTSEPAAQTTANTAIVIAGAVAARYIAAGNFPNLTLDNLVGVAPGGCAEGGGLELPPPVRDRRPAVRSFLRPPTAVASSFVASPIAVNLVGRNRLVRARKTDSTLFPPILPPDAGRIRGSLTKPRDTAPRTRSFLLPPVLAVSTVFARPIDVALARIKPGRTAYFLRGAVVITPAALASPIKVALAPQKRGAPKSKLPQVVYAAQVYPGIEGFLAKRKHVNPRTRSFLRPPESAFQCLVTRYVSRQFLNPPAYMPGGNGLPSGDPTTYALDNFSRVTTNGWGTADVGGTWNNTGSRWSTDGTRALFTVSDGSAVVEGSSLTGVGTLGNDFEAAFRWTFNEAWAGNLNRINMGWAGFFVRLENTTNDRVAAGIFDAVGNAITGGSLVWPDGSPDYGHLWWLKFRQSAGRLYVKAWKDGLSEPANWLLEVAAPYTNLNNGAAFSFEKFSTVPNTFIIDSFSLVSLDGCAAGGGLELPPPVRDRRPAVHSFLRPPTATQVQVVYYGPKTPLVRVRPQATHSVLRRPAVVGPVLAPPIEERIAVQLTRAELERKTISRLSKPVVVDAFRIPVVKVSLVRIRPVRTNPELRPPTVIDLRPQTYFVDVHLAYSKRGAPKSVLRPAIIPLLAPPVDAEVAVQLTRARLERRLALSHLSPPAVIDNSPQVFYLATWLTYSLRGKPKSFLGKPTDLVDQQDLGFVHAHLAYSRRGRPVFRLQPPAVVGPVLARAIFVHLAPSSHGIPKSILREPTVVAPVLASPIRVTLDRIKPAHTIARLFPPAVVTGHTPEDVSVDVTLAPQRRGQPKSALRAPTVVAPVLAKPIGVALVRIKPQPTTTYLFPPVVVYLAVELSGPETSLAPSRRGVPKSVLFPPIHPESFPPVHEVIAVQLTESSLIRHQPKSRLFPPTVVFTAVELSGPDVTLSPQKRGVPKSKLAAPTVVAPVLARAIQVSLVRIKPVKTHPALSPPVIPPLPRPVESELSVQLTRAALERHTISRLGAPTVVDTFRIPVVSTRLVRIRPALTHSALRPPTVIDNSPQVFYLTVGLAPSKRGVPKSHLLPAIIPPLAPPVDAEIAVQLTEATLIRRASMWRLSPPTVVYTAVELSGPETTVAPSSRGKAKYFLRPMGSPAVVYAPLEVRLAPSTKLPRAPHAKLFPPTVIDNRPQTYYLTVALAYSLRGKPKPHLFPPPTIQATPKAETVVAVTLAYSLRGKPKPRLNPPTVVTAATPYLRAIDTTLVRIRPVRTLAILGKPTDTVGLEDQGRVATHLAYSRRGRPLSILRQPTVVSPVLARPVLEGLSVQLTRVERERKTMSRLSPPTAVDTFRIPVVEVRLARIRPVPTHPELRPPAVIDLTPQVYYLTLSLAYSLRGTPKSELKPPADTVGIEDQGRVNVHLAYSLRGTPKSRLAAPTVVAPVLARPIDVALVRITPPPVVSRLAPPVPPETFPPVREEITVQLALAEIRQRKTTSRLKPPVVVFTAVELSGPKAALAPSARGNPKSFLRPMGSPAVVYAPLETRLAPSTRLPRAPHSELKPPTVIDNRPQTFYLAVSLAYSLRGKAKPRLFPPPAIQATAKAETVLSVTLAYSLRGTPKSFLTPPTVVTAATPYLRPVDVTLAPQARGHARPFLGDYIVPAFSGRPIAVTLAPQTRGKATPLLPKTIYEARSYAPVSVTLAPQKRGTPKSLLTQVVYEARVYAPVRVELAPSRRGTPKSALRQVEYAAVSFRPVAVTLAPSFRGQPKPTLSAPTVVFAFTAAPTNVQFAYSRRGRPVSRLSAPTAVAPFFARAVDVTLAPQRRGTPKSTLAQVVYEARSYAPVRVVLAPAARLDRTPHSRLAAPTAVSRFVAAPVSVTLAAQRRGKTTSFLTSVAFERRSFAAVQTHLAPPTRVGRAAHSKLGEPTVVFPFLARPVSVELVRIRPPRTIARLTPIPTVAFFARPVSVELARTPQKSVVSALRPPTVIDLTPQVFYLNVTLAQIRPPKTTARIVPPAVVNPYRAPVSSFIQVHLAYSRRGRPIHHLGFVPGLSHGGIICGVILDLTSVCQDITADVDTIIDGGVLETHVVSETTTASTVIMGETLAETRVEQDIE